MTYCDSLGWEAIKYRHIVVNVDGDHGVMIPTEDCLRVGLPPEGYQGLLNWFRDRDVNAQITGPHFSRFQRWSEQRHEFDQWVVGHDFVVSYDLRIHRPVDQIRYEEAICEYACKEVWHRRYSVNMYDVRKGLIDFVEEHELEYVSAFCGGLPGSHLTVEVPELPVWH